MKTLIEKLKALRIGAVIASSGLLTIKLKKDASN